VQDNTTNYLDLGSDGVIDVTQSSTPSADHMRLLEVIASGAAITGTPTDKADRTFPDNAPQRLYMAGLEINVTSATAAVISSGVSVADTTNVYTITTDASITVDITNSVGALGLDQGTESSSTWYAIVLIGDSTGVLSPSAVLVDASDYAGSIVLPSGYDIYRRVGWVRNDSSSDFLQYKQVMHHVSFYEDHSISSALTSSSWTDISCTSFCPTTTAFVDINTLSAVGNNTLTELYVAEAGRSGSTGGVVVWSFRGDEGGAAFAGTSGATAHKVAVNGSQAFAARTASTVDDTYLIGYDDTLLN
jgi:hypothetical protein